MSKKITQKDIDTLRSLSKKFNDRLQEIAESLIQDCGKVMPLFDENYHDSPQSWFDLDFSDPEATIRFGEDEDENGEIWAFSDENIVNNCEIYLDEGIPLKWFIEDYKKELNQYLKECKKHELAHKRKLRDLKKNVIYKLSNEEIRELKLILDDR